MKNLSIKQIGLIVVSVFLLTAMLVDKGKAEALSSLDTTPVRIAINGNSDLLVSDYTYGQILTVTPDTLDIISEFNVNGRPLGIAWADDLIYVGNSTTGQVEVYNTLGEEQFVLGYGSYPVEVPQDIAVGNGNVYVVDGRDKVVKVFTQDGTFVGTIPENGYAPDVLANPTAITVDDINQRIYVSDYGDLGNASNPISPRIQVFNYNGSLSSSITAGTTNKYRFTMPQGLTVNGNGQLFVIDSPTGKIFIYDATTGSLLGKMSKTDKKSGTYGMEMPLDLVIDPSTSDVFVTNSRMASIKVFAGAGAI